MLCEQWVTLPLATTESLHHSKTPLTFKHINIDNSIINQRQLSVLKIKTNLILTKLIYSYKSQLNSIQTIDNIAKIIRAYC